MKVFRIYPLTVQFIIGLFLSFQVHSQIDQEILLIGRNIGTHTFHDGSSTRIFGFAETLSAPIKIPGPTLEVTEGDSVKIDFWNMSQGAPHTIHLHGLDVDQANDGVGMLSFEVEHSQHGYYYFKAPHAGTYLYHCHVGSSIHLQAGMYGLVIVRPPDGNELMNWENGEAYGREFSLLASEVDTVWHNDTILDHVHDSTMALYVPDDFSPQYFLVNGLSGTQLSDASNHLVALKDEKVYFRLANIGYYGVRYIFPSAFNTRIVASDGRPLPVEEMSDTIEVLPGERYEVFSQIGQASSYPIGIEHFNLNTQQISSSQQMTLHTSSLGINSLGQSLLAFPNPSNGMFTLHKFMASFIITDMLGKEIMNGNGQFIDLSPFQNGLYRLKTEDGIVLPLMKY
jgi:FtsP/CotA-like multicopper oxidase with cupredoxin domain